MKKRHKTNQDLERERKLETLKTQKEQKKIKIQKAREMRKFETKQKKYIQFKLYYLQSS